MRNGIGSERVKSKIELAVHMYVFVCGVVGCSRCVAVLFLCRILSLCIYVHFVTGRIGHVGSRTFCSDSVKPVKQ